MCPSGMLQGGSKGQGQSQGAGAGQDNKDMKMKSAVFMQLLLYVRPAHTLKAL